MTIRRAHLLHALVVALLAGAVLGSVPAAAAAREGLLPSAEARLLACPSHSNPSGLKFWIHVKQWCALPAVRGQAQFKLQMEIHNRDEHDALDIHQSRMRLIVHELDPDRWTPPRYGPTTYDRPIRTTYGGERVWAVPANANDAYDPNPLRGAPENLTFATHWGLTGLEPGATLNPGYHEGDLVFYVPAPKRHGALENVVGMAYIKGHEIIALCHPEDWGPKEPAGDF